jgi:hypothetical protein
MPYVLGSLVALAGVGLIVGALTGRVKVKPCCAPVSPEYERLAQTEQSGGRPHVSG